MVLVPNEGEENAEPQVEAVEHDVGQYGKRYQEGPDKRQVQFHVRALRFEGIWLRS